MCCLYIDWTLCAQSINSFNSFFSKQIFWGMGVYDRLNKWVEGIIAHKIYVV